MTERPLLLSFPSSRFLLLLSRPSFLPQERLPAQLELGAGVPGRAHDDERGAAVAVSRSRSSISLCCSSSGNGGDGGHEVEALDGFEGRAPARVKRRPAELEGRIVYRLEVERLRGAVVVAVEVERGVGVARFRSSGGVGGAGVGMALLAVRCCPPPSSRSLAAASTPEPSLYSSREGIYLAYLSSRCAARRRARGPRELLGWRVPKEGWEM